MTKKMARIQAVTSCECSAPLPNYQDLMDKPVLCTQDKTIFILQGA